MPAGVASQRSRPTSSRALPRPTCGRRRTSVSTSGCATTSTPTATIPTSPVALQPDARGRDTNNWQPRGGVSWDVSGNGTHVASRWRRDLLGPLPARSGTQRAAAERLHRPNHPAASERRRSSAFRRWRSIPPIPGPRVSRCRATRSASIRRSSIHARHRSPAATPLRLGNTGLYADVEGIYVKGDDEIIVRDVNWRGNATGGRPNTAFNQINTYTNEGRSTYKAFVASVNGTITGGHIVTASFTVADKKNINDDFSPALTDYPNDPADIEAEYGRSRADERVSLRGLCGVPAAISPAARTDLRIRVGPAVEPPPRLRLQRRWQELRPPARRRPLQRRRTGLHRAEPARDLQAATQRTGGAGPDRGGLQSREPDQLRRELDPERRVPLGPDAGESGAAPEPEPAVRRIHCGAAVARGAVRRPRFASSASYGHLERQGRHRHRCRGRYRPRHRRPLRGGGRQSGGMGRERGCCRRGRGRDHGGGR